MQVLSAEDDSEFGLEEWDAVRVPPGTWRGYEAGPEASRCFRFAPASLTAEEYDDVVAKLTADGISPAEGLDYEICFGSGDDCKVSMVWDSQEQFNAFGARLGPILAELGIDPGAPEILEIHNIIKR